MARSKEEILADMNELEGGEEDHGTADDLLCELLENLGHADLVEAYNKVHKWYS